MGPSQQFLTHAGDPAVHRALVHFAVLWIVLGISSFLFFHFNRNGSLKRRIFPSYVIAMGVIFGCFFAWLNRGFPLLLVFALPVLALVLWLNSRKLRFCLGCGRTLYHQSISPPPKACPHCRAALP